MAKRTVGRRRLSSADQRVIFDRDAAKVMREREAALPAQKRVFFKGAFIAKHPGNNFWNVSGTQTRFKTLGAAKSFVNSRR